MTRICDGRRRAGFTLVSTVLLIGIAGLLLTTFASLSVNKAIEIQQESNRLQMKWAVASVQRMAFNNVNNLLTVEVTDEETSQVKRRGIPVFVQRIELGNVLTELVVADESAKLDLNLVHAKNGNVKELIGDFARDASGWVDLRPKRRQRDSKDNEYVSWDQVFADQDGALHPEQLMRLTTQLTCWGKKVNLDSASDGVLFEACKLAAGAATAQKIVDLRQDDPDMAISDMIAELEVAGPQAAKIREILVNSSISQSIWVKATHQKAGSKSYWFAVREGFILANRGRAGVFRYQAFRW